MGLRCEEDVHDPDRERIIALRFEQMVQGVLEVRFQHEAALCSPVFLELVPIERFALDQLDYEFRHNRHKFFAKPNCSWIHPDDVQLKLVSWFRLVGLAHTLKLISRHHKIEFIFPFDVALYVDLEPFL